MGYFNKVELRGTVAKDVVIKKLERGSLASFRLGTVKSWKGKDGKQGEKKDWHNIFVSDESLIQSTIKSLKMGDEVFVVGELANRKYQDNSGIERLITEIKVNTYDGGEIIRVAGEASSSPSSKADLDECPF